tara:strand:+ start:2872 stop:3192 length:321 start_codon:yes stop_codon:yes gene_type:complete
MESNTREKVDALLRENARIWANLHTGSMYDLGSDEAADARWQELLAQIKELDPETWELLSVTEDVESTDWDEPSFIDTDKLAEAEEKIKSMERCDLDQEECLSCGA